MKYMLLTMALMSLTACDLFKSTGCTLEDAATRAASTALATTLSCTNVEEIQKSVKEQASKAGLCKDTATASIGGDICKTAATSLVDGILSGAIPATWGCTGGIAKDKVLEAVKAACDKI